MDEKRIAKEIETLLHEATVTDEKEDALHGAHSSGDEIPLAIRRQEDRIKKLKELSADSGYSSGENLKKVEQREIDACIPDRAYQSRLRTGKWPKEDRFHKEHFAYDEIKDTCPEGKKLHFSYFQKCPGKEPLRVYRCSHCQECPSLALCTKNKSGRTISRYPYEKELKAMRQKLSSPEGKATYRKFVFFSDAVRIFGKVTKKYIDSDGEYCVDIETHAVNQRGEDVMPRGDATIALRTKNGERWYPQVNLTG